MCRIIYCIGYLCEYEHTLIKGEWICPACGNPASSGLIDKMDENDDLINRNRMFVKKFEELGYEDKEIVSIALGQSIESIPMIELSNHIYSLAKKYRGLYDNKICVSNDIERFGEHEFNGGMAEAFEKCHELMMDGI